MKNYIAEMDRCIELASQARGMTSPNPMVGCVILNSEGKIISEGYHKKCGENHAEREALLKLSDAVGCTLVVNLEPCSHFGKTPPCTDLIIEKGIKTVVYGMQDPNPLVCSNGLEKLKAAGIEVIGPVSEDKCRKLNEIFIKNQTKKQTFVAIKTATTIDGKTASRSGDSKWITSDLSRQKVRNIRKFYDAILTSSSTVIADNPTMEHNFKVILDTNLRTDFNSNIYKQGKIYVFHSDKLTADSRQKNIELIPAPSEGGKLDINFVLDKLYELNIMSVLVEAGGILNGSFVPFADKIYHFTAPKILCDNSGKSCFDGKNADKISQCYEFKIESTEISGSDILTVYSRL